MGVVCASYLLTSLLISLGSAFLHDWLTAPLEPHFIDCISTEQVTFRCWWNPGVFQNLTSPGSIGVYYRMVSKMNLNEWHECPDYNHDKRECFFDANHTSLWTPYCLQLRSHNTTYYNQDDCFTVENIVRPDPPVALNWTVLNISPSGLSYDVMVNWESAPSADAGTGWMRIVYEVQYREQNSLNWTPLKTQEYSTQTQQTIFGLQIGKEYEVHIHSRLKGFTKYGEFSDSIFIQMTEVPTKETSFPLLLLLVFGIVGISIIIMFILVTQQNRLMMILLPPVPAPKIKGIDPELLKKGKLEELNFILSGGGMGGLPVHAPDFYQDEPWVEFIEVDAEEADAGEKEENQGSDTQRLLGLPPPVSLHLQSVLSFPDDDSGRASCYDSDLHDQDTLILMSTLLPGQPEDREEDRGAELSPRPLVHTQAAGPQTWVNTDFYAQVSNVMPSGGVVLSPGQHLHIQESMMEKEEAQKKTGKEGSGGGGEEAELKKEKELQFQLLVVDPEGSGYTTETNARQMSTPPTSPTTREGYQSTPPQTVETKPPAMAEGQQSPYILPDSVQSPFFVPVADYTVVQEMNNQQSLLLNPPPPHQQSPTPCHPQHPLKALPAMPVGYVTPDLLGNLSP